MRVAVLTTSWPRGPGDPAGHFVETEVRELEGEGHEVTVLTPPTGGAFGWPGVAARLRERPLRALDAVRWVARAALDVRHMAVDRVIAHWAVPCAWPIAAAAPRARLEVVSHGADVRLLVALPAPARNRLARAIAARASRWRFVAATLRDTLLASLEPPVRARVERIAYVRAPSLDMPDVREAIARKRDALGTARIAVSVGRLVTGKRVDRAIEHVARATDLDALVVVGDGPDRDRLERLARARGVDARFVGAVPRSDALAWIGAAHVVIHASATEGCSTVLREADALGRTVVDLTDS